MNGDKTDNRVENLMLMTKKEHHKIHYQELKHKLVSNYLRTRKCVVCSNEFETKSGKAKYCSPHCFYVSRIEYYKQWKKNNETKRS